MIYGYDIRTAVQNGLYSRTMMVNLGENLRALSGPVLITGHTGFKGTWLTLLLEQLNIPVIGIALPAEEHSLFNRADRLGAIPESFFDIRNFDLLSSFVKQYQPSTIVHLAAQPLVLESYEKPRETFETNVLGTANVLSAAHESNSVIAVVVATTDKVYKNDNLEKFFVESDPLQGNDPYSASKVGAESVVIAWQQISKLRGGPRTISVRAGNVIGGGDWSKDRLLPDLIRGFSTHNPVTIRNARSTRPWQHVLDPLNGYVMALEAMVKGVELDSLNFGPESASLAVKDIVETSRKSWPSHTLVEYLDDCQTSPIESTNLQLNSAKARAVLNWSSRWGQSHAVTSTIEWWNKVINHGISPYEACQDDLRILLGKSPNA